MKTKIYRTVISDNNVHFSNVLSDVINRVPQLQHLQTCINGFDLVKQLNRKQADLYLIDLFTPIMTGLEAIKIIRNRKITSSIIAYSNTYQNDIAETLNGLPNIFYCQKNSSVVSQIIKGIIFDNNKYYSLYKKSWRLNTIQVEEYINNQKSIYEPTFTERQIIIYACEGLSNKEIGEILNLSSRTIETHIKRLTVKTNVKNKLHLIAYCVKNGLNNFNI